MKKTKIAVLISLISILLLLFCATTGPGGKKSLILVSTDQEVSIGQEFSAQIDTTNPISQDTIVQNYVNDVGQKIARISDRADLDYHFSVIDTPIVNAFACPGGFIYIYTGLLEIMDNEAQLAGVLAHEISHVVARHGVKRLQKALGLQVLLSIALGESSEITQNAVTLGAVVLLQAHSRENEFEADEFGTYYMTNAGYNPEGMVQLQQKFLELSQGGQPGFFEKIMATHPPSAERVKRIENQIAGYDPEIKNRSFKAEEYQKIKSRLKKD